MDDLKPFYDKYIFLLVANFIIMSEIDQVKVEKALTSLSERWVPKDVVMPSLIFLPTPEKSIIYFVNIPDAKQSVINIVNLSILQTHPNYYKAVVANYMHGSGASVKLFMVLGEEKRFIYGVYSNFMGRSFMVLSKAYPNYLCQVGTLYHQST